MTTYLEEVPGARERPGGCPVQIARGADGTVTLLLPSRGVSPFILVFASLLLGNLFLALYTGLVLLLAHRSILGMAQISPSGLPASLKGWEPSLLALLFSAAGLGLFTIAAVLRPLSVRETVTIGPEWVRVQHREWGRVREYRLPRAEVRGFLLRRVPPGLDAGILTLQGRGEQIEIGEFLREADREWVVSAGNALLGT